ncbi:MAG: bifunctional MaoC family dehydratase/OB-fold nucleic acid binding domain-containing protein, partial [Myxococcales bacterium]|nr:bifunctional MaoC family dehydratase/OB-fold nucleic acid binding domain-containing protein [Myxococcales bacterium]
ATNCEQEYRRYVRPGDRIITRTVIESISDEKKTALGDGYFYNTRTTFTDQNGDELGWMTFRVLKFKSALPPQTAADSGGGQARAMPKPQRLRPAINEDNRYFWDGVKAGKLLIQKCSDCGKLRHPGRPMCPSCRSIRWETLASTGRGTVHSFVVMHYPHAPTFEYPFAVAVVDLEEKPIRFVASIRDCDPHAVEIGMPVELVFSKVDDELVIPEFRPAGK